MNRILITGAAGFIGGRLVKMLKENTNLEINILLRTITKASRISIYPLNYFIGTVIDETSLKKAMGGCDVVVHCAHDFSNPDANLKAADLIAKQCLQQGIKKLIYISSFAVHKGDATGSINEDTILNDQWDYAINKIAIEQKLIELHDKEGLPVIILRPTIVYGPFSFAWTTNTINQMINGRLMIPYEGERVCNAVYIDDVIQAIAKALDAPASCHGKSYIVSGPAAVSWRQFYRAHLFYSGTNEPLYMSDEESRGWEKEIKDGEPTQKKASLLKDPITFLKKTPIYTFYQKLLKNPALKKKLLSAKTTIPRPLIYLEKDAFETLSCKGEADISKIKAELHYVPAFTFVEGMRKTSLWIDWANLNLDL